MDHSVFDFEARCRRMQARLEAAGLDYLLVTPSSDLLYLIGLNRPQSERLTLLMLPRQGDIRLLLPAFERTLAEPLATFFQLLTWDETDDPTRLFFSTLPSGGRGMRMAVAGKMFVHFLFKLQTAAPEAEFVSGSHEIEALRMQKDPLEIEQLEAAGAAADRVYQALLNESLLGMTEIEVKALIMRLLTEHGHDTAGGAIVGVGENGASPHHHVSARRIAPGDAVIVDFGGSVRGYWSDMTRTFHVGHPSPEFARVYATVNESNQQAFEAVRPGVTAESIDRVARDYIENAGFRGTFLHRTGHGLGLDIHEPPYLVGGDTTVLKESMVFSIEPGIYIQGKFGVRIEDIVVVTSNGARRFNRSTHELQILEK